MKNTHVRGLAAAVGFAVLLAPGMAPASEPTRKPVFDWHANAAASASRETAVKKARAAIIKARGLNANATWVCSPAGFGQPSRCARG